MKKVFFLIGLISLMATGVCLWQLKSKKTTNCKNCNILLIDIDILRADALPCYGYFRNTAPNICGLAKKSVLYKDNYANATWTLPSIFSTITSQYPTFHGVQTFAIDRLPKETPTIAKVLKTAGYKTVYVGENQNPAMLTKENGGLEGYDEITTEPLAVVVNRLKSQNKPWFVHYYNSDLHVPYLIPKNAKPIDNLTKPKSLPIYFDDLRPLLNNYLEKHSQEIFKKKAREDFPDAFVQGNGTELVNLYYKVNGPKEMDYLYDSWKPIYETYMGSFDKSNPDDAAYVRMMYDTNIKLMDEKIGTILKDIDWKKIKNNLITVVMSDHGESFGEHGLFTHGNGYHSELFKTPLIINSPVMKNKIIDEPVSNVDIFPTLLDLTGIENSLSLQGQSLLTEINRERLILGEVGFGKSNGIVWQNNKWLYVLIRGGRPELFDKENDPEEKINVLNKNKEIEKKLKRMTAVFESYKKDSKKTYTEIKIDPDKIQRLQKEGYF